MKVNWWKNDFGKIEITEAESSDEVIGKYFLEAELDLPEVKTVSATVERVSPVNEREKK